MKLGFIGLGKMGMNMVTRLIRQQHQVVVYAKHESSVDAAKEKGAIGGKLTGAGGGGYMMLFCRRQYQKAVRKALMAEGLVQMEFRFDFKGAKTIRGE